MFFANKKSLINSFCLIFFLGFLYGCASPEKTAYEKFIENRESPLSGEPAVSREIAYLKNISQFEENNFQFVTKQMKAVIKNYARMKRKLSQIETKLDQLLHQLTLKEKAQDSNEYEAPYDNFVESKSGPKAQKPVKSENPLTDKAAEDAGDIKSENSSLIEEEITDDTDIFPNEEIGADEAPQDRQKTLGNKDKTNKSLNSGAGLLDRSLGNKEKTNKPLNKKNASVLMEAKNLFQKESYENAISKFQKYRDENPKGSHYPEATFYIGQSFRNLKMPVEAKVFFKEVIKSYPQSLWASRAKKILKE